MAQTDGDQDRKNFRAPQCPECKQIRMPLRFLFPSKQRDPHVENVIWRFQFCYRCSWTGDVVTGKRYKIERTPSSIYVNGQTYSSLKSFLIAEKIIE